MTDSVAEPREDTPSWLVRAPDWQPPPLHIRPYFRQRSATGPATDDDEPDEAA